MMKLVLAYYEKAKKALEDGASIQGLLKMPIREKIGRFKYTHEDELDKEFAEINDRLDIEIANTLKKEEF